jgi:hypothetical protein
VTAFRADPAGPARGAPEGAPSRPPAPRDHGNLSTRLTVLLVVLGTGAGGVLRFAGIGHNSLWIDEAFSVYVGRQPLADLWRTTVHLDFHPPLYYALLHVWMAFGDGETALRSLSALLSTLTLPVVFLIGARLGGRVLGVASCGLVALSPIQIAYAQQVRMYALMTFWAALSILFLVQLLEGPGRRRNLSWAAFAVSTALTMLSHNTGVLLPVSIAVFVGIAWVRGPRPVPGLLAVATGLGAAVLLWLPWLPYFLSQAHRVDREFWISPPSWPTFLEHWHDLINAYGPDGGYRSVVLAAVVVLVGLGVRRLRSSLALLMLLLVLVPVAVELLVSIRRPIFFTQTLVWTSVPFSILLTAGILALRARPVIALVTAAVLVLNATGIRGYYRDGQKEDWRDAARYVSKHVRTGEQVLFSAAWAQIPFDYYYGRLDGPPLTSHGLPTDVPESQALEAKMTRADLARLDRLTTGHPSVWVVYSHDWYTDPQELVRSRLNTTFRETDSRDFTDITVVHYRAGSD